MTGRRGGLVMLLAVAMGTGGMAMGDPATITVGCVLPGGTGGKAAGEGMAAALCALFRERVAAHHPGAEVRQADGGAVPALLLVVQTALPGRVEARLAVGDAPPGPLAGTARADGRLDTAALAAFLDGLIAAALPR